MIGAEKNGAALKPATFSPSRACALTRAGRLTTLRT